MKSFMLLLFVAVACSNCSYWTSKASATVTEPEQIVITPDPPVAAVAPKGPEPADVKPETQAITHLKRVFNLPDKLSGEQQRALKKQARPLFRSKVSVSSIGTDRRQFQLDYSMFGYEAMKGRVLLLVADQEVTDIDIHYNAAKSRIYLKREAQLVTHRAESGDFVPVTSTSVEELFAKAQEMVQLYSQQQNLTDEQLMDFATNYCIELPSNLVIPLDE
jgi:hypothetical protein